MNIARFLQQQHVPFALISHPDTFDAQHMAAMIHVTGRQVAKTVLLRTGKEERYAIAVLPANRKINFEAIGQILPSPMIRMATELEMSEQFPDCEVGALPPFGSHYGLPTLMDESLLAYPEVVFEGNTHHESIRMKLDDFRRLEEPLVGSFT